MVRYLTQEQILLIHSIVIDETGGSHGVKDHGIILSVESLPKQGVFGKELYPTVFHKAAVYARSIISNHPFIDGNKRTAITVASVFLEDNEYRLHAKEGLIKEFALRIIREKLDIGVIAAWFKRHTIKI